MDIQSNAQYRVVENPIESITMTLTMTPDEAAWLMKFTGRVSGSWDHPVRMITNKIYYNLDEYPEIGMLSRNKDASNMIVDVR